MLPGLIATLAQTLGITVDKIGLSKKRIPIKVFIPVLFFFLALFTLPLICWLGGIDWNQLFTPKYLFLYIVMIILAFGWNILYYVGIKAEQVQEFELILMLNPLLVILLATMFFKEERDLQVLLASFIAAMALIFAHVRREHLQFSKGAIYLLGCVVIMSIETIFHRFLLEIFSPASLYFSRTLILFIIFVLFYHPKVSRIKSKAIFLVAATSLLGVIQFVARFYGYRDFGVIITTLMLTIAPILVYFVAYTYFKERVRKRMIISGLIILAAIIWATIAQGG